uniref:Uncharacterized protein n=1 Tax=uncultured Desulfobacterium sp. TaxID=201089 RepID=E1YCW4_9BACT|nr:unknown protein [uncultured Desulfobacterium sp.]
MPKVSIRLRYKNNCMIKTLKTKRGLTQFWVNPLLIIDGAEGGI